MSGAIAGVTVLGEGAAANSLCRGNVCTFPSGTSYQGELQDGIFRVEGLCVFATGLNVREPFKTGV